MIHIKEKIHIFLVLDSPNTQTNTQHTSMYGSLLKAHPVTPLPEAKSVSILIFLTLDGLEGGGRSAPPPYGFPP